MIRQYTVLPTSSPAMVSFDELYARHTQEDTQWLVAEQAKLATRCDGVEWVYNNHATSPSTRIPSSQINVLLRSLLYEHGIRSSVRRHVTLHTHITGNVLSQDRVTYSRRPTFPNMCVYVLLTHLQTMLSPPNESMDIIDWRWERGAPSRGSTSSKAQ